MTLYDQINQITPGDWSAVRDFLIDVAHTVDALKHQADAAALEPEKEDEVT
jgi:hypothetical protein